ncbi:tripartite tricarboxylate transporter TctB family protein [Aurantimonas sp. MSK8Z-1]|uniref:tripartite tricarboxylate transporter TctB family protein n=1 Tax=Mangrovibrevibacter kandeliae TaxID=2968473 RepID=UPI0021192717|nr:tripartite tricarboxylate transporter TctB family protein [Aurantimonas sp. MSK8Z-1]MCW4114552.1 tripartite tricarboxylate transporter TctB family protein [Aurantimonas sp. MSK8Z-1]
MSDDRLSSATERRPDRAAFVIALLLLAMAAVIFWNTLHLNGGGYAQIGPKAFPYAISAGLAVLSVWTGVSAWRGDFPEREPEKVAPIVWIVAGLAAQLLLLKIAGFSIATGLLFALTARAFGQGPLWKTIPIGIVISFLLWLLFTAVLQLSLPAGPLEHALF